MVAVPDVHAHLFFVFSYLVCHLEDTGIGVFWLDNPPDCKETELRSSSQQTSPLACKNTEVFLEVCHA